MGHCEPAGKDRVIGICPGALSPAMPVPVFSNGHKKLAPRVSAAIGGMGAGAFIDA
jgi:hypothetical protein